MIRTSRSRLEIRQEPDATASIAGLALVSFGLVEMITMFFAAVLAWAIEKPFEPIASTIRFVFGAVFVASGWLFLRGRSRVVIDLDHRMVARYLGVGGHSAGGNATWDLAEFRAVVLVSRERRRMLVGATARNWVVCLRRHDGGDLELYWAGDAQDGARAAAAAADFAELPYYGREPR
ncbi:MAG: hypothetical protein M0D55_02860 [Elusimicrobiota bacterium]|nr:MAG: hypothetical protein M0D55_02860 [Elusimicrobiota bacterium]